MITCRICGEVKTSDEFYKEKTSKTGYRSDCKECVKTRMRSYREVYKDEINAKQRSRYWRKKNGLSFPNKPIFPKGPAEFAWPQPTKPKGFMSILLDWWKKILSYLY